MCAVIVHSPLVGPATMIPLADQLEACGLTADVPDLRTAVESSETLLQRAVDAAIGVDVVIGHSGAGAFLPAIAAEAKASMIVFVDAVVPEADDAFTPSRQFVEFLDTVPTADGLMAPWNEWWPPEVMAQLVPDPAQRRRIASEIRECRDRSTTPPFRYHPRGGHGSS